MHQNDGATLLQGGKQVEPGDDAASLERLHQEAQAEVNRLGLELAAAEASHDIEAKSLVRNALHAAQRVLAGINHRIRYGSGR